MATVNADIAFARNPAGTPGVVDITASGRRLLAIVDGWGSWGTGAESAARAQTLIRSRWMQAFPASIEDAARDLHDIAKSAPLLENEYDLDDAFHAVVLRVDGLTVQVTAAGAFPVVLFSESRLDYLLKPRMLLDAYLEKVVLTPAEIEAFPHKNVYVGPYLHAARADSPMSHATSHELVDGESVVVASPTALEDLLSSQAPTARRRTSAVSLRDGNGSRWAPPVVILSCRS